MIAPRNQQGRQAPQIALAPIAISNHQTLTVISIGALLNKTTPENYLGTLLYNAAQELYEELGETMFASGVSMLDQECERILSRHH